MTGIFALFVISLALACLFEKPAESPGLAARQQRAHRPAYRRNESGHVGLDAFSAFVGRGSSK